MNKLRSRPCRQSKLDKFRVFKYAINGKGDTTAASGDFNNKSVNAKSLLVRRHNVQPGTFLIYRRGELLWAGNNFNGYSTKIYDLKQQLMNCERDQARGLVIPPDFKFRTTNRVGFQLNENVVNMRKLKMMKNSTKNNKTSNKNTKIQQQPQSAFPSLISNLSRLQIPT